MSVLKRTIPSAALLVLGLVALLVVAAGGMFLAKASGGGGWGGAGASSWGAAAASGKADTRIGDKVLFDDTVNSTTQLMGGQATFQVRTSDAAGHTVLLVRLAKGVAITQFLGDLAMVNSGATVTPEREQAARNEVDNVGGAMVTPQCSVAFTVILDPGTYYLIDFHGSGISDAHPKVQEVGVTGTGGVTTLPQPEVTVSQEETTGAPRFVVANQLPATGLIGMTNKTSNTNETAFLPLKPGIGEAAVKDFFANFATAGKNWQNAPFAGGPCGLAPISPGRQMVAQVSMQPGQYVMASFAIDPKTKKRAAEEGMYQLVNLVPGV